MKQTFTKLLGGALFALLLVPSTVSATITATWDWGTNNPTGIQTLATIQNTTATITSSNGVVLTVDATASGAALRSQVGNAQFNAGTKLLVPVVSTTDIVTFVGNSYNYKGVKIGEEDFDNSVLTRTHTATTEEVTQGYVVIESKGDYLNSVSIELAYMPTAEFTIASWRFDTGYTASGLVYTPNEDTWAGITQAQAKNGDIPQILANTYYTNQNSYIGSVSNDDSGKTYYSVKENGSGYGKVFCLYPVGISNDITSYTDASKHIVYYEFSFPTIGLKNINISYDITRNGNQADDIHVVYSTDNGTTWVEGNTGETKDSWWLYKTNISNIDANNKSNVIVRLLPENGKEGQYMLLNFVVKGKRATTAVTISDAKFATYYNSIPVELPANLQAATIDGETSGTLTLNYRYGEGDIIPGGTAVLLKATAADTYNLIYAADNTETAPAGNLLHGSDVATTTTGGDKYYALGYGTGSKASVLGFYWMSASGAAFESGAHKAWLALSSSARSFFSIEDEEVTSIAEVRGKTEDVRGEYFNLAGQRVAQPTKGLYIVNGKKIIIK